MPIEFNLDRDAGLLIWEMHGRLLPEEVLRAIGAAGSHPDFDPSFDELIVFGPTILLNAFDTETLKATQAKIKASYGDATVRNVRSAVVCPSAQAALVTRLWRALALADDGVGLDIKIFDDVAAARAWLGRPEIIEKEAG